jgi:hypothetical protein
MKLRIAHYKSPINEYDYVAVDDGSRDPPRVSLYDGRLCYVSSTVRTRSKVGRSFYNVFVVRFLDDGSAETMGAAQFDRKAKVAPLSLATGAEAGRCSAAD